MESTSDNDASTATNSHRPLLPRPPATVDEHRAVGPERDSYPVRSGGQEDRDSFTLAFEVAQEVAVVQLISESGSIWMTPVGGHVALSRDGEPASQIEVITYNIDGVELTRGQTTLRGG